MKKIFIPLLCLIIAFCSFSCSNEKVSEQVTQTTVQSTETQTYKKQTESETETVTENNKNSTTKKIAETTTKEKHDTTSKKVQENKKYCYLSIDCTTILSNMNLLAKGKQSFVPKSGIILEKTKVEFKEGDTAFEILKRGCKNNVCTDECRYCKKDGIQLEYSYTPGYNSYYVEGIHQLYEKDCSTESGWMFCVNGKYPDHGCSEYKLKNGDFVEFRYTCSLGDDISA